MQYLFRFATWVLIALVVVILVGVLSRATNMVPPNIRWIFGTEKPEKPRDERDAEATVKCRGYTMLVNMVGAKKKLQEDRIRLLCTILNLEKTGDACDVFAYQWELVIPGWGRRQTDTPLPFSGRNVYVPQRRIWYIEKVDPDISEIDRNKAILLAESVKKDKLCPRDWKATTIVRPEREHTTGNQRPNELAAIKDEQKMVRQPVVGESEFEFYYPKPK